jgi:hypothetical protein
MDFAVFAYQEDNIAHLITFNQILLDLEHNLRVSVDNRVNESGELVSRDTLIADTIYYMNSFSGSAANYSYGIFTLVSPIYFTLEGRYEVTVIRRVGNDISVSEPWTITPPQNGYSFSWGTGSTLDGRGVLSAFEWSSDPRLKFWGFDENGYATGLGHDILVGEGQQVNGVTMVVHENFVYAAFSEVTEEIGEPAGGAWMTGFALDEILDVPAEVDPIPAEYNLSAYPNPFNPLANIRFDLIKPQHVNLSVFDIQGRLVKQLLDEPRRHGFHSIAFDGANLSAGIYFVRLNADDFTETAKLILLK